MALIIGTQVMAPLRRVRREGSVRIVHEQRAVGWVIGYTPLGQVWVEFERHSCGYDRQTAKSLCWPDELTPTESLSPPPARDREVAGGPVAPSPWDGPGDASSHPPGDP